MAQGERNGSGRHRERKGDSHQFSIAPIDYLAKQPFQKRRPEMSLPDGLIINLSLIISKNVVACH